MRLKRLLHTKMDWVIAISLILLVCIIGAALYGLVNSDTKSQETKSTVSRTYAAEPDNSGIHYTPPPDPKYPPPAKTQRTFYRTYNEGDLSYSIEKTDINIKRLPALGPHVFTVNLTNTLNRELSLMPEQAKSATIHCIAKDGPYRAIAVEVQPLQLKSYEKKQIKLSIDVGCLYLGTADSKYYWRIY